MAKISPKMIYDEISKDVVGQEEAKRVVSTGIYLHLLRFYLYGMKGILVPKPTMLLHGPSGCGKTFLIRKAIKAVGKFLENPYLMPLCEVDCSGLTPRGYVGENLHQLVYDFEAQCSTSPSGLNYWPSAIFYLDEIDKACLRSGRDGEWARDIQYSILKLIEGGQMDLSTYNKSTKTVDMNGPLFIFSGNFPGIRHERETQKKPGMGFAGPTNADEKTVQEELQKAGMVTQLVGRIQLYGEVLQLTEKELLDISLNHICKDLNSLLKYAGIKLKNLEELSADAVKEAIKNGTGARGLYSCIMQSISTLLFERETEFPFEHKFLTNQTPGDYE